MSKIEANLALGKRSLHGLIRACSDGFTIVDAPSQVAAALVNVNTAAEWEAFQNRATKQTEAL
ncbi:hypothetical protein EON79_22835 [bacterium]|nr:MAG: hypothetical protein EON79_22835 [bacterium]